MVWILLSRGKIVDCDSDCVPLKDLRNEYPIQRKARENPIDAPGVVLEEDDEDCPGIKITGDPEPDPLDAGPPEEDGVDPLPPLGPRLKGVARTTIAPS
jgi:hypothetical protein